MATQKLLRSLATERGQVIVAPKELFDMTVVVAHYLSWAKDASLARPSSLVLLSCKPVALVDHF